MALGSERVEFMGFSGPEIELKNFADPGSA